MNDAGEGEVVSKEVGEEGRARRTPGPAGRSGQEEEPWSHGGPGERA